MTALAIGDLGTPELLILFAVVILLFGASKLPALARGSGRALRIFRDETKGLMHDDSPPAQAEQQLGLKTEQRDLAARQAALNEEAARLTPARHEQTKSP